MPRFGVAGTSVNSSLPVTGPATGEVLALKELGPLLSSDERFGAMHDLLGVHSATTDEGYDLRVAEIWSHESDGGDTCIVVSLSQGRQVLGVWDLGLVVECVESIECLGPGRFEIAVVPQCEDEEREPNANRINVAYTLDGAEASALRVRYGKRAKIVPKSARRRDLFVQRIVRVHEIEVEREDVVHARVFEVNAQSDVGGIDVLLQLSDAQGTIRTFDVGLNVAELGSVTCREDRDVVLQGRTGAPDSRPVTTIVRALGTRAVPERIAIARSH